MVVPSLAGFATAGPPYVRRLVELAAGQVPAAPGDRVVLVPHSGAGVFAPYLAAAIPASEVDVIFADSAVPAESHEAGTVGSGALKFIRDLVRDGMVPPWPQWWPPGTLAKLFPDQESQRLVTSEASPLPLGFYQEQLPPAPRSWSGHRSGYLCFSESYRDQAAEASRRGWPVRLLPGQHLHMVVSPAEVAAELIALADEVRPESLLKDIRR